MNPRERILAIFEHKPVENIVFQPRFEHWYNTNKKYGTLPERYAKMSLLEVFDDLGCSVRDYAKTTQVYTDTPKRCVNFVDDPGVKVERRRDGDIEHTRWITPVGTIENRIRMAPSWHIEEFPVKTPDDMRVMEYVLKGGHWEFDSLLYDEVDKELGDRTVPMLCIPRINIMRISVNMMGFENAMYALFDDPVGMESLINTIDETDLQLVECASNSSYKIINFGDNVDQNMCSPSLFERYMLPAYNRRTEAFRKKGKFTHSHWDGNVKLLLHYARDTGLDGIEALTPIPQGDVTVSEIKEALGDMIVLDGIPMLHFMPNMPIEELDKMTHEVIDTFAPNLILGISDELSPVCDIERVRRVAHIVKTYETV